MQRFLKRNLIFTLCALLAGSLILVAQADEKPKVKSAKAHKPATPQLPTAPNTPVSQNAQAEKQTFFPELTKFEKEFQEQLNQPLDVEFFDTPLNDVINFIQESTGGNFIIFANDLGEEGLTIEEPVTISLSNVSLKTTLEMILNPIGLTYVVDRDIVKITTWLKASEMWKTRVYPVADLCQTPVDYLVLESVIKNANLGKWRELKLKTEPSQPTGKSNQNATGGLGGGGTAGKGFFQVFDEMGIDPSVAHSLYHQEGTGGTMSFVPQSKSLVISQTYQAHNAIVELLTQLRQARTNLGL